MNPAELIVRTLDRHLLGPAEIRLMGGAAMILAYGQRRGTEDVDLLMDTAELEALVERADLGAALEATNEELEPRGLYLSHIWGPEQQILRPSWREACRAVPLDPPLGRLSLSVLGPLDLMLSKLCRADAGDLADIAWLIDRERLTLEQVEAAMREAIVPEPFAEGYAGAMASVRALFQTRDRRS